MAVLETSEFVRGYVDAIFFTDAGPDSDGMDGCTVTDLSDEAVDCINSDCANFQQKAAAAELSEAYARGYDEHQAGVDFWLTRNGHGAGFWDRDVLRDGSLGDRLSDLCRHTDLNLYKGDDGRLYLEG